MPERNGRACIQQIRDKFDAMARDDEELLETTAVVEHVNSLLKAGKTVWAWPTIGAALISKHHWLVIACDSCGTVVDMDLAFKRRDPNASIRIALDDVRCAMQRSWADTDYSPGALDALAPQQNAVL